MKASEEKPTDKKLSKKLVAIFQCSWLCVCECKREKECVYLIFIVAFVIQGSSGGL